MNYLSKAKCYFTEDKSRIFWWSLASLVILTAIIIFIVLLEYLGVIFGVLIGIVFFCGLVYKIFVGFPSVFGSIGQVIALCVLAISGTSLFLQWRVHEIADMNEVVTAMSETSGIPKYLLDFLSTPLVAGCGIGLGLILGMLAEITCAVTYRAHTSSYNTSSTSKS